jgi:hypothetical protein
VTDATFCYVQVYVCVCVCRFVMPNILLLAIAYSVLTRLSLLRDRCLQKVMCFILTCRLQKPTGWLLLRTTATDTYEHALFLPSYYFYSMAHANNEGDMADHRKLWYSHDARIEKDPLSRFVEPRVRDLLPKKSRSS